MTHTSGFEETGKDLFVKDAQHMGSLEYYVKNHIPERIFPPVRFLPIRTTRPQCGLYRAARFR